MMRLWICAAAVNGFIGVAMGAFAAHFLKGNVPAPALDWIETGARYALIHALALLAIALLGARVPEPPRSLQVAGWGFLAGTILFSGGLYVMGLTGWLQVGLVVPLGGLSFLIGWVGLMAFGLRNFSAK